VAAAVGGGSFYVRGAVLSVAAGQTISDKWQIESLSEFSAKSVEEPPASGASTVTQVHAGDDSLRNVVVAVGGGGRPVVSNNLASQWASTPQDGDEGARVDQHILQQRQP
jgi:hypothetical protein